MLKKERKLSGLKRLLTFCYAAVLILTLCACSFSRSKPSDAIKTFSGAMNSFDIDTMQNCLVIPSEDLESEIQKLFEISPVLTAEYKEWAKQIQFTIVREQTEGDHATVAVNYSYADASGVINKFLADSVSYAFSSILSGENRQLQDADMDEMLKQAILSTNVGSSLKEVQFDLINYDKQWRIKEVPYGIYDVLEADSMKLLMELADLFDSVSNSLAEHAATEDGLKPLYLKKTGDASYALISDDQPYDKMVFWDSNAQSYYDTDNECWLWYNQEVTPAVWQYWVDGISSDFGEFGWMEYDNGWYIETDYDKWEPLPDQYDISKLWHIEE